MEWPKTKQLKASWLYKYQPAPDGHPPTASMYRGTLWDYQRQANMTAPTLPDWQSDWLYALVLGEAGRYWSWCKPDPTSGGWRYVLIEEWSSYSRASCRGKMFRAWIRDADGLREITLDEYKQYKRTNRSGSYPYVLVRFHILPDRDRVVLGMHTGNRSGRGARYLVEGEGDEAKLTIDPTGGIWMS